MPAINNVVAREAVSQIAKRGSNWASQEAGVIVVFCIVFIVLVGVIGLFITRRISSARARRAAMS